MTGIFSHWVSKVQVAITLCRGKGTSKRLYGLHRNMKFCCLKPVN